MWAMSDEDSKAWDDRLKELRKGSKKDQIVAILMDLSIGGTGMYEGVAEQKADEILKLKR